MISRIETYHPVIWNGGKVRLHYAKAEDLADYLNLVAIRGEVVVQFWLRPGDAPVELNFIGYNTSGSVPATLRDLL
ncbi:hypothetical protein Q9L42_005485 [Methylomarinum sp. Ch1-1]|uniref:Uncharacterized protein n=1 Tax=Methylomarinum roseum TaxID=3067653 RepID=A0AAU7NYD4_9GAMM|nr:hypothetical protein [Methylomarinum sp. Ch1-1]MDP4522348.1 hypothetical protein [Methylomarinum sp. Ch1-1]